MAKRRILDAAMLLLLPMLMAYSLIGEAFHEAAGTLMLALFLLHHGINREWWKSLFRGQYSPQRVFQTTLNLSLLLFMIVQPLCGILMSKHLFAYLPTAGMASVARTIHLPLAYWGFVLMSLHAGTHLRSIGQGKTDGHSDFVCGFPVRCLCFFQAADPGLYVSKNAVCLFRLQRAAYILPDGSPGRDCVFCSVGLWDHTNAEHGKTMKI